MRYKPQKRTHVGGGKVSMELFGQSVIVNEQPPKPCKKVMAYHLFRGAQVPPNLVGDVANYLKLAKYYGIKHTAINHEIAECLIKKHYQRAVQLAKAA